MDRQTHTSRIVLHNLTVVAVLCFSWPTLLAQTADFSSPGPKATNAVDSSEAEEGALVEMFSAPINGSITRTSRKAQANTSRENRAAYEVELAEAEIFLIEEYGDELSEEELDLLLKEHAAALLAEERSLQEDELNAEGEESASTVLPENVSHTPPGMNISAILSGRRKNNGVLCNGSFVSIGNIVPVKFGETQEYWRLVAIRDRRPLWVQEDTADGLPVEVEDEE